MDLSTRKPASPRNARQWRWRGGGGENEKTGEREVEHGERVPCPFYGVVSNFSLARCPRATIISVCSVMNLSVRGYYCGFRDGRRLKTIPSARIGPSRSAKSRSLSLPLTQFSELLKHAFALYCGSATIILPLLKSRWVLRWKGNCWQWPIKLISSVTINSDCYIYKSVELNNDF